METPWLQASLVPQLLTLRALTKALSNLVCSSLNLLDLLARMISMDLPTALCRVLLLAMFFLKHEA